MDSVPNDEQAGGVLDLLTVEQRERCIRALARIVPVAIDARDTSAEAES